MSFFLVLFLRGYISFITRVTSPSTLDLLFIGLFLSHDLNHEFGELTQLALSLSLSFN